ncbi:MAG TPA: hypothetical protein VGD80_15515, partial [Kofleriaceae bacterium]
MSAPRRAREAISRWLVLLAIAGGCANRDPRPPDRVPVTYRDVRESAGHTSHIGKVPCADCHGDGEFTPPPAALCEQCHPAVVTPLHRGAPAPSCQDCHAFGKENREPTACMRCHDKPQGPAHAVGLHADQPCGSCHRPHQS